MKYTIDSINEILKDSGWSVVSDQYKTLDTEMTFKCPEGH